MQLTNKHNLSEIYEYAIRNNQYDAGDSDITVTALIAPPQIRFLKEKFKDEITQDVSDMLYAMEGSATHTTLQLGAEYYEKIHKDKRFIIEKRFFFNEWHNNRFVRLSGQVDLIDTETKTLYDYKRAPKSVLSFPHKPEWEQQLNLGRYLAYQNSEPLAERLVIGIVLRDWSKIRDDYAPIVEIDIPIWSIEKTEDFIQERLHLHYKETPDECTSEERWEKPTVYAVHKEGRKSAVKLYDNMKKAESHASEASNLFVEVRQGLNIRCQYYCQVMPFCEQVKRLGMIKKENKDGN